MKPIRSRMALAVLALILAVMAPLAAAESEPGEPTAPQGQLHEMQALLDSGDLVAHWVGQGRVAGDIVELTLENRQDRAIAITFETGTVLVLEDEELAREFQPIILEETVTLLVPAEGTTTRMLRGYCLDYELLPPAVGRDFPYRFPPDTVAYTPAIEVLRAALTYDADDHVLPVERQRTVVIQRAIWTALGQMSKEKLKEDILMDAASEGKTLSDRQLERLVEVIWNEIERLLALVQSSPDS